MNKRFFSAILALALVFESTGYAQKVEPNQIKRIDDYVRELTACVERPTVKLEIYTDVSETRKPKWKKFRSETSFEKFRESHEVYEIAYVWRKNGKIAVVNFTFTSGSGDWAHYVFHRFRPDGTLAKVEADLRTFYGRMSVERNFYYSTSGKLILKQTKYRDIGTNKPKKPGDDFLDNKVSIYKNTVRLPFVKTR